MLKSSANAKMRPGQDYQCFFFLSSSISRAQKLLKDLKNHLHTQLPQTKQQVCRHPPSAPPLHAQNAECIEGSTESNTIQPL